MERPLSPLLVLALDQFAADQSAKLQALVAAALDTEHLPTGTRLDPARRVWIVPEAAEAPPAA